MAEAANFNATKSFGIYLQVDDNNRLFRFSQKGTVYSFDELLDCELMLEQNKSERSSVTGVFSSGLFGGNFVAAKLGVRVFLLGREPLEVNFLSKPERSTSPLYKAMDEMALKTYNELRRICPQKRTPPAPAALPAAPAAPAAAPPVPAYIHELRELKALVDEGVITREDYDAKKKLLLGL